MAAGKAPAIGKDRWKAASLRSGFGRQVPSTKPTAPGIGFGSSDRDGFSRTYVSPEADRAKAKAQGGTNSPGPVYRLDETLGRQFLSTRPSTGTMTFGTARREGMATNSAAPGPGAYKGDDGASSSHHQPGRVKFGTAPRDAAEKIFISTEHEKTSGGRDSPGPSAYDTDSPGKRQLLSDRHREPAWSMGSGARSDPTGSRGSASLPGVGQYDVPAGLGRQVYSTKKSSGAVRFGSAGRDAAQRIYLSPEHDRAAGGGASPGPTTSNPRPAYGPQQLSRHASAPAWGFTRGGRSADHMTDSPGPGEYNS